MADLSTETSLPREIDTEDESLLKLGFEFVAVRQPSFNYSIDESYSEILSLRRAGSGNSLHSASDESDTEPSPPVSRRGRRQAAFDCKSLGLVAPPEGDLSPTNSCDESEGSSAPTSERPRRKRSSVDLGINYPGDLLVQGRQKKVLIKRNTIADFAASKAFQASTASLFNQEENKKYKSTFSLLKLIDKKSHRTKDNSTNLEEVLSKLKTSEFKDSYLTCYKNVHWSELIARKEVEDKDSVNIGESERKRREAVWELFKSECVFLLDHLMVLKHCFMEPMKKVQVEGHVMFAEPQDLFGNLDELCYVSYTFCRDFISLLLKDAGATDFGRTPVLIKGLQRFAQLTRDGEVYHDYCLNYSKAIVYLEQLRKNEDFCQFERWCEQDPRCHRLQMTDLLISPMQHCTKVPLLLSNIRKYTGDSDERLQLTESLINLETSLKNLEAKMKWLKNFERVQEIQQQIVWLPITELDPRTFIPEFLRSTLSRQPCERLLASPKRQLLHEGPLTLLEISKTVDMYMFLFDDILLLTRVKKPPRKKSATNDPSHLTPRSPTDGAVFVVHRQPIALDRFTIHDVRPPDGAGLWEFLECGVHMSMDGENKDCLPPLDDCNLQRPNLFFGCLSAANGLRNAFVLVQISRFQQIIAVYTLQAPSESSKVTWLNHLRASQSKYKEATKRHQTAPHGIHLTEGEMFDADPFELDGNKSCLKKSKSPRSEKSIKSCDTISQTSNSNCSCSSYRTSCEQYGGSTTTLMTDSSTDYQESSEGLDTVPTERDTVSILSTQLSDLEEDPNSEGQFTPPESPVLSHTKRTDSPAQRIKPNKPPPSRVMNRRNTLKALHDKAKTMDAIYI